MNSPFFLLIWNSVINQVNKKKKVTLFIRLTLLEVKYSKKIENGEGDVKLREMIKMMQLLNCGDEESVHLAWCQNLYLLYFNIWVRKQCLEAIDYTLRNASEVKNGK